MMTRIQTFVTSENGAISVDWMVLTAAIIGLTGASAGLINSGVGSASGQIGKAVASQNTDQWK